MKKLKKLSFPKLEHTDSIILYNHLKSWFDRSKYIYNEDYKFEWDDTGFYVPDFIYCDEELAIMLKLRYNV